MLSSDGKDMKQENSGVNPAAISAIAGLLSSGLNNKNAELILSLKPYLSEKRQKKTDEAIKLLKLLSLLPALRESGLIENLL